MIIPFFIPHSGCPHQCVFCNQKNITGQRIPMDPSSIPDAITGYLKKADTNGPVQVAFYGGSFTALAQYRQRAYLEAVQPFIRSGRIKSIRLSTRPDCITEEILSFLKGHHVETIELGAQSMDDNVLACSGRGHRAKDTVLAVSIVREYKFTLGLQLMVGLPGDRAETFMRTVDTSISLRPDFVRLYPTLVVADTPLETLYRSGRYNPLSLDEAVLLCKEALVKFDGAGIEVIRVGLQSSEELEKTGAVVAGPYHSAFRQLVDSSLLLDKMRALLTECGAPVSEATFFVHPHDLSAAAGQKRANREALKQQFGLRALHLRPDPSLPRKMAKLVLGKSS